MPFPMGMFGKETPSFVSVDGGSEVLIVFLFTMVLSFVTLMAGLLLGSTGLA